MITDSLSNLGYYLSIHPLLQRIDHFLKTIPLPELPLGQLDLGENFKAIVDQYETKNAGEKFIECHRKFIDFQLIVSGTEEIGYCNRKSCKLITGYNEEKDYEVLAGNMDFITLQPDDFAVFYPHDGHMPGLKSKGIPCLVKKVVFKLPV